MVLDYRTSGSTDRARADAKPKDYISSTASFRPSGEVNRPLRFYDLPIKMNGAQ